MPWNGERWCAVDSWTHVLRRLIQPDGLYLVRDANSGPTMKWFPEVVGESVNRGGYGSVSMLVASHHRSIMKPSHGVNQHD
jgi:hypothetical protein